MTRMRHATSKGWGRGYRMVAEVRPLRRDRDLRIYRDATRTSSLCKMGSARLDRRSTDRPGRAAASWAITHYRGASKPAERTNSARTSDVGEPHDGAAAREPPLRKKAGVLRRRDDRCVDHRHRPDRVRYMASHERSAMHFEGPRKRCRRLAAICRSMRSSKARSPAGARGVRIFAQLIEASSDHHLWARTYERDLKNVLALQDEIAQDITEHIRVKLTPKERSLLIQVHAVDPEAYEAYLRGRYWWSKRRRRVERTRPLPQSP